MLAALHPVLLSKARRKEALLSKVNLSGVRRKEALRNKVNLSGVRRKEALRNKVILKRRNTASRMPVAPRYASLSSGINTTIPMSLTRMVSTVAAVVRLKASVRRLNYL